MQSIDPLFKICYQVISQFILFFPCKRKCKNIKKEKTMDPTRGKKLGPRVYKVFFLSLAPSRKIWNSAYNVVMPGLEWQPAIEWEVTLRFEDEDDGQRSKECLYPK